METRYNIPCSYYTTYLFIELYVRLFFQTFIVFLFTFSIYLLSLPPLWRRFTQLLYSSPAVIIVYHSLAL